MTDAASGPSLTAGGPREGNAGLSDERSGLPQGLIGSLRRHWQACTSSPGLITREEPFPGAAARTGFPSAAQLNPISNRFLDGNERFPSLDPKRGDGPSPQRSSKEKSSESAKHHKTPPRTSTLCTVIESLETRAMLAGLGQDSLSGLGSITAVLLPGVSSPPGIVFNGGSPTLGSAAGNGGSQSTGPVLLGGSGSGTGSSSSGSSSSAPNGPVLLGGSGSGTGSSSSGSSSSDPNGPVLSSQYTGGSNTGGQGTGTSNSGTLSGSDLWLLYGAGLGASSSSSGTSGSSSSNLLTLLTQYTEGSSDGGQGNGTGGTLSNADLWRLYWSGAGAGSSSGYANGSLANDPTPSAKDTGGSGGGMVFFVTGATGGDAASSGSRQGSTGSNTLTLADGQSPVMTTPLVYQSGSDDGPGVVSGVWTGGVGEVQFVLAADTGTDGKTTSKSGGSLIATMGDLADDAGSYVGRSSKSLILGDWTDEKPTELSIGAGIGLGVLGVDLPLDIRDLSHTLTHREWSYKWGETLAYNTIGLIPLIGVIKNLKNAKKLKYLDDAGELAKRSDDAADAAGDAGRRAPPASDPPSQPPSKAPSGPQEPRGPLFIGTPNGRVFRIPEGWVGRPADNGKGIVFQRPGAHGNSDMIRIMDPTPDKPSGYFRYYNSHGQPLDPFGKPGRESATHIPIDYE